MLESIIWSCSHHRLYRDIDVIFLVVLFSLYIYIHVVLAVCLCSTWF